ncbi:hypothetical protein [uncultured Polaribacter sp.]|uniref:hypothetical protein n=1 Tax=uncultured Polaribacter sp. TaxID=174711 RepID=UPI00260957ED|nr:hypothetical protein [uncultured Polaribacter sp.]
MSIFKKTSYLIFSIFLLSCSQTLDFEQINDYEVAPVFSVALVSFALEAEALDTFIGISSANEIEELTEFRVFENSFIRDNLTQLGFNFELVNQFNRDFNLQITLLDDDDNTIHEFQELNIVANNIDFKQEEIITIQQNPNIINVTQVLLSVRLGNTSLPIDNLDSGFLELKSAVTVHLETSI